MRKFFVFVANEEPGCDGCGPGYFAIVDDPASGIINRTEEVHAVYAPYYAICHDLLADGYQERKRFPKNPQGWRYK